jgi:sugar phosphate isomerase/epimerase
MFPTLNQVTSGGGLPLGEYIALAARHGFKGADFSMEAAHDMGVAAAHELFAAHSVRPGGWGLSAEWRRDEETFRAGLPRLAELARGASRLGATRCITWVMPQGGEPAAQYEARVLPRLIEASKVLGEHGVQLGLEFLGPKMFRREPEQVWFYDIPGALDVTAKMHEAGATNAGLLIDCWHWYTGGGSIMDLASVPLEQIVHVHINDAPEVPVEDQIDNVRLLPGESGVIDIRGFLRTLSALGYDGPVAVETFSQDLNALAPDESAALAAAAMCKVWADAGLDF